MHISALLNPPSSDSYNNAISLSHLLELVCNSMSMCRTQLTVPPLFHFCLILSGRRGLWSVNLFYVRPLLAATFHYGKNHQRSSRISSVFGKRTSLACVLPLPPSLLPSPRSLSFHLGSEPFWALILSRQPSISLQPLSTDSVPPTNDLRLGEWAVTWLFSPSLQLIRAH